LVASSGLSLDEIVWDADEVLWDWTLDASRIGDGLEALWKRSLAHREYYLVKPGMFELIWGMRHAALEAGDDGCMRIWTNGYPWRLWRVARSIPGFARLLEPPDRPSTSSPGEWARHPRIFYRLDFVRLVERWLDDGWPADWEEEAPECRPLIVREFERDPCDSTFKLPELAEWYGKSGFETSEYLVDDHVHTIERFAASGRRGVHVRGETPRIGWGVVPNTVWRNPFERLIELSEGVAPAVATSLERLAATTAPAWRAARPPGRPSDYPLQTFHVDVPDGPLRREWLEPMRRLERRMRQR
jgi:hypothetical protein